MVIEYLTFVVYTRYVPTCAVNCFPFGRVQESASKLNNRISVFRKANQTVWDEHTRLGAHDLKIHNDEFFIDVRIMIFLFCLFAVACDKFFV